MQAVDLSGLVKIWTTAIKAAEEAKSGFTKTGEICETFFTGAMDSMWNDNFRARFLGGLPTPQFRLTLNKTFELTSIVGPTLMWDYAGRTVKNYSNLDVDPSIFPVLQGLDPSSPEAQQMAQRTLFFLMWRRRRWCRLLLRATIGSPSKYRCRSSANATRT